MKLREFVLVLFAFLLAGCAPATGGPLATEVAVQATIFAPSPTPLQPVPPTATPVPGPESWPGATSFVLLGLDSDPAHPERNAYGIRTDVFVIGVLVTYPQADAPPRLVLFSLPRDLYLPITCVGDSQTGSIDLPGEYAIDQPLADVPREAYDRINAAYYRGGPDCVRETIRWNFGITVDGPVVAVEMGKFVEAVDALGGLDITPGEDYVDFCGYYLGTDGNGGDWRHWRPGVTRHLTGNEVLCYVRGRRTPDGDLDRNRRTLEVLQAARQQWTPEHLMNTAGADGVATLMSWAWNYVSVDNWITTITWSVDNFEPLRLAEINTARMRLGETVEFYTTPGGASVVVPAFNLVEPGMDQADYLMHWFGCAIWAC